MAHVAQSLFIHALATMLLIALPAVCAVAAAGIVVGAVQTAFGVQDQNVSFAPKLIVVALLAAVGGASALEAARQLMLACLRALPALARP